MTRTSEREVKRAVENLAPATGNDAAVDLTPTEAEALRALFHYRTVHGIEDEPCRTPSGGCQFSQAFLEEALEAIDDDLETAFRESRFGGWV